jgi:hypothetical protein
MMMDLVFLIIWVIGGLLAPFAIARMRPRLLHTVRFLAAFVTVYLGGISVIIGVSIKDVDIFVICMLISLWGGLQMLLLPKISPRITNKFGLEW